MQLGFKLPIWSNTLELFLLSQHDVNKKKNMTAGTARPLWKPYQLKEGFQQMEISLMLFQGQAGNGLSLKESLPGLQQMAPQVAEQFAQVWQVAGWAFEKLEPVWLVHSIEMKKKLKTTCMKANYGEMINRVHMDPITANAALGLFKIEKPHP